jgi:hypothetical protein
MTFEIYSLLIFLDLKIFQKTQIFLMKILPKFLKKNFFTKKIDFVYSITFPTFQSIVEVVYSITFSTFLKSCEVVDTLTFFDKTAPFQHLLVLKEL